MSNVTKRLHDEGFLHFSKYTPFVTAGLICFLQAAFLNHKSQQVQQPLYYNFFFFFKTRIPIKEYLQKVPRIIEFSSKFLIPPKSIHYLCN